MAKNLLVNLTIAAKDQASKVFATISSSWARMVALIGAGGLFAASINEAQEFEAAMARVQSRASFTAEQLNALKDAAEQAGQSTAFSATQAADGLGVLVAAGLDAEQAIASLTPTLNLATLAGVDLAEAASAITNTAGAMGLALTDTARIADVFARGANLANTTAIELAESLGESGGVARNVGVSFEQLSAASLVLAQTGIKGSVANTTLKAVLTQLINPASQARQELAKIGATTSDFESALRAMAAAGDRSIPVFAAFGDEASAALRPLVASIDTMKKFEGELSNVAGAAERGAAIIASILAGAFNSLKSAFSSLLIQFATPLLDPIEKQVKALTDSLRKFSESKVFTRITNAFTQAFSAALESVQAFIKGANWEGIGQSIEAFSQRAEAAFLTFRQNLQGVATIGAAVANAFATVWYGITAAVQSVATGVAGIVAEMLYTFAYFSRALANLGAVSEGFALKAEAAAESAQDALIKLATNTRASFGKTIESAASLGNNLATLSGDIVETGKSLAGLTSETEEAQQALDELDAILRTRVREAAEALATATRNYAEAQKQAVDGTNQSKQALKEAAEAIDAARVAYNNAQASQARYIELQTEIADATQAVEAAQSAYADAAALAADATADNAEAAAQAAQDMPALADAVDDAKTSLADLEKESAQLLGTFDKVADAIDQINFGDIPDEAKESAVAINELINEYNRLIKAGDNDAANAIEEQINKLKDSLNDAVKSAKAAKQEFTDAFETLGIESQASLEKTAEKAREAFETIRNSAEASASDVQRAFEAYKDAALKAAEGMDAFETLNIESQASLEKTAEKAREAFETIRNSAEASASDVQRAFEAYKDAALKAAEGMDEAAALQTRSMIAATASALDMGEAVSDAADALQTLSGQAQSSIESFEAVVSVTDRMAASQQSLTQAIEEQGDAAQRRAELAADEESSRLGVLAAEADQIDQKIDLLEIEREEAKAAGDLNEVRRLSIEIAEQQVEAAKKQVEIAEQQVDVAKAQVNAYRAQATAASDNAKAQEELAERLELQAQAALRKAEADGEVTKAEREAIDAVEARIAAANAEAEVQRTAARVARNNINVAEAEVAAKESQVDVARKRVDAAEEEVDAVRRSTKANQDNTRAARDAADAQKQATTATKLRQTASLSLFRTLQQQLSAEQRLAQWQAQIDAIREEQAAKLEEYQQRQADAQERAAQKRIAATLQAQEQAQAMLDLERAALSATQSLESTADSLEQRLLGKQGDELGALAAQYQSTFDGIAAQALQAGAEGSAVYDEAIRNATRLYDLEQKEIKARLNDRLDSIRQQLAEEERGSARYQQLKEEERRTQEALRSSNAASARELINQAKAKAKAEEARQQALEDEQARIDAMSDATDKAANSMQGLTGVTSDLGKTLNSVNTTAATLSSTLTSIGQINLNAQVAQAAKLADELERADAAL